MTRVVPTVLNSHTCTGSSTKFFYKGELVHLSVLNSHFGESPYTTCSYGNFLNLYCGGRANNIFTASDFEQGSQPVALGVQPRSESTLRIPEASRLSDSPTG